MFSHYFPKNLKISKMLRHEHQEKSPAGERCKLINLLKREEYVKVSPIQHLSVKKRKSDQESELLYF